jgi:hypothetical protein
MIVYSCHLSTRAAIQVSALLGIMAAKVYPNERTDFRETPIYRDSLLFFLSRQASLATPARHPNGDWRLPLRLFVGTRRASSGERQLSILENTQQPGLYRVRFPSRENCFTAGELSPGCLHQMHLAGSHLSRLRFKTIIIAVWQTTREMRQ